MRDDRPASAVPLHFSLVFDEKANEDGRRERVKVQRREVTVNHQSPKSTSNIPVKHFDAIERLKVARSRCLLLIPAQSVVIQVKLVDAHGSRDSGDFHIEL